MLHEIPVTGIGPQHAEMARAVERCVHCGFCLPACPTYEVLGEEMDSPRGRIFLMKEVLEGKLPVEEAAPFVDRCLGCVSCETACPSGVAYGELLTPFRAWAESKRSRSWGDRLLRAIVLQTLPYPRRFRQAMRWGQRTRWMASLLPKRFRGMLDLLPAAIPAAVALPEILPAEGPERARVALVAGCAQQVLAPNINMATLRVLARNGVTTLVPQRQGCCGALAAHTGALDLARRLAQANLKALDVACDAIISNAAGCGSGMKEYPLWFAGDAQRPQAEKIAAKTRDISQFLDELGFHPPRALAQPLKVAYHDACHLAHAQRVKAAPRRLLQSVAGIELMEIAQGELCCGSAGSYNLEHPDTAAQLGESKARHVLDTGCDLVVTGNIGCLTQLQVHLAKLTSRPPRVLHTMELLDELYGMG